MHVTEIIKKKKKGKNKKKEEANEKLSYQIPKLKAAILVSIKQWSVIIRLVNGAGVVFGADFFFVAFFFRPVHKVLGKNTKIHQKSNGAASQPAKIDQDVFAIEPPCFIWLASLFAAARFVYNNGQDIGCVSETGKQEEEHAKAFSCLASPVENELRQSRSNVENRADISKHLTQSVELEGVIATVSGSFLVTRGPFTQEPSCDSSGAHHNDDN